jgi:uncharacterized protein with HEPN domain
MLEALQLVRGYTEGLSKVDFLNDRKTQQAVILNIQVVGEAATRLAECAPELVAHHPEVDWKGMRGMRNRLAHGYFEINLDLVWDTVQLSLPALEEHVLRMLREL